LIRELQQEDASLAQQLQNFVTGYKQQTWRDIDAETERFREVRATAAQRIALLLTLFCILFPRFFFCFLIIFLFLFSHPARDGRRSTGAPRRRTTVSTRHSV
jgi:hypothetical protein